MKQVVVIGCGRFGYSVATTLEKMGNEVMVVDKDEDAVNSIANKVTHSVPPRMPSPYAWAVPLSPIVNSTSAPTAWRTSSWSWA